MNTDSHGVGRSLMLTDQAATEALGHRIAATLAPGAVVALKGDLGAGKTTLARGILRALGVEEVVPSPTFTLVQTYETPRLVVRHYDFYRIEQSSEIGELGFEEALEEGAVLVEWPERAEALLPERCLNVVLEAIDGGRRASLSGPADWIERIGDLDVR